MYGEPEQSFLTVAGGRRRASARPWILAHSCFPVAPTTDRATVGNACIGGGTHLAEGGFWKTRMKEKNLKWKWGGREEW